MVSRAYNADVKHNVAGREAILLYGWLLNQFESICLYDGSTYSLIYCYYYYDFMLRHN